ncbi:autophagy protein 5 [Anthonomus grandis grandis]|uniref:autophagy protein 5 n=1 Tax=Anthonomus grandis grandis TaxID=2921223 RepID=UPI00216514A0|nr:autophagy protein 5 [Anthonomus grandis grandis]XP_050294010.1 autophagy protein 5 [Anthonomus grandis grandis]
MANDREILREVWEGKLPVCFKLNPDEVVDLQQPDPFYLMVPRLSYFPLVTDKVRKHFIKYVSSDKVEHEMWLEYNGQPMKWHFPIGVLYDSLVDRENDSLPWVITVHFDKFPETQIYRFNNKETVESYFMACLKEADVLKHRGQIATNMQKKDHNQLWLGLQNDKFDQFWAVNRKLMEFSGETDHFKHIPFRCYIDDGYRQKLVKPVTDDGRKKTLRDLLTELFPDKSDVTVKIHGMIPPMDTPLQWMSEHLSYPDNFLHLCIV